jgi:mRNA (2'-O-methyladenosine-N6-)-methyltransferase
LVDEIVWVKVTVNRRLAKSHGYYLQHAKEVCMVARKNAKSSSSSSSGQPAEAAVGSTSGGGHHRGVGSDVIISERRGQSQKPEEIYDLIEQLVPGGGLLQGGCSKVALPVPCLVSPRELADL